jgi:Phage integrase family
MPDRAPNAGTEGSSLPTRILTQDAGGSLFPQLIAHLAAHKTQQDRDRAAAGAISIWEENNLVWCQENGRPIDARADWEEWKEILKIAGVRKGRIHDGRHFAATLLLLLGIDEATVMALMGLSDRRMLRRYQHALDELRLSAARGVGDLLFGPAPKPKPCRCQCRPKIRIWPGWSPLRSKPSSNASPTLSWNDRRPTRAAPRRRPSRGDRAGNTNRGRFHSEQFRY